MTEQSSTPIVVNGHPEVDQIQAGLRVTIVAAGAVATALGYVGMAGKLNALLLAIGPVATAIAFLWGQYKTRTISQKAAAMANMLPDEKAVTK